LTASTSLIENLLGLGLRLSVALRETRALDVLGDHARRTTRVLLEVSDGLDDNRESKWINSNGSGKYLSGESRGRGDDIRRVLVTLGRALLEDTQGLFACVSNLVNYRATCMAYIAVTEIEVVEPRLD
jgi:hypothetical protein